MYIKYKQRNGSQVHIWEMSPDYSHERPVYSTSTPIIAEEYKGWKAFEPRNWGETFEINVLTRDEYFLEII